MEKTIDFGPRLPTLRTGRLAIRAIDEGDAPDLFEIFSDPEVTRYWSSPPFTGMQAAHDLVREIESCFREQTLLEWGITRHGDDRVIGTCTLGSWDQTHRRAEIGYALGRRAWKQGIAIEAVREVLGFGFETLRLHRVEADVDPRNAASIRLLERIGFEREGYLRERYFVNGEIQDTAFYGLLRSQWRTK